MALTAGSRIGPYEIVAPLGAGGMGEVYRARDTRLNRDVAIKILPEAVAGDPDRLARFEREAQALAALNHPNIAAVYAVEGLAIVMELVSGEDLSARIGRGRIPLAEALPLARQIADAVAAAHEAGIIHRDLKPANIKVKDDGTVKVLDFGLAKALEPPGEPSTEVLNSPTRTNRGTHMGVILGTAAYMAPEQARGKVVDKRADIWAFGVVLYEMLTGIRPFVGDDVTDLLAAVVRAEPDWSALPATTPALVRRLLKRCLAKDPKHRLHDIADAKMDLDDVGTEPAQPAGSGSSSRWMGAALGFLLGVAITATAFWLTTGAQPAAAPAPAPVTTSLINVLPADEIGGDQGRPTRLRVALSANGRTLVFSAVLDEHRTLYLRNLDELQATPIAGTEGGDLPFFSPDGQWIGYWAKGHLWKVRAAGGPSISLCAVQSVPFGATWAADDQIVFAPTDRSEGLWQVSSSGGKAAERLTKVDAGRGETGHRLPAALPGSGAILFTIRRGDRSPWDQAEIAVYSTRTHTYRVVLTGGADARYVAAGRNGYLVFVREGVLMAAPFDVARLAVTGDASPVGNVMQAAYAPLFADDSGAGQFSLSDTGTLVYIRGGVFPEREDALVLVDQAGRARDVNLPRRTLFGPRLSWSGQRVAVGTSGRETDLLVAELDRPPYTRLRTKGTSLAVPLWTPDGTRLAYRSDQNDGRYNLFWRLADGTGEEALTKSSAYQTPASWTPDGHVLAFYQNSDERPGSSIWLLSIADRNTRRLTQLDASESGADFSHDGRAIAYASNDSGQTQVYVQPYPGSGRRLSVSSNGGYSPVWSHDSRTLFYLTDGPTPGEIQVMSAPLATTPDLKVLGPPKLLFHGRYATNRLARNYDVTRDGLFLMVRPDDRKTPITEVILVQNWTEELKRLMKGK